MLRLPAGTMATLHELARDEGTSATELMRQAVRRLANGRHPAPSPAENGASPS